MNSQKQPLFWITYHKDIVLLLNVLNRFKSTSSHHMKYIVSISFYIVEIMQIK